MAPVLLQKNARGEVVRINILFYDGGLKRIHEVVRPKDLETILVELQKKSLDRSVIQRWFSEEKLWEVQQYRKKPPPPSNQDCVKDLFLCLILPFCPCILCAPPPPGKQRAMFERVKKWDDALRKWQADFNKEVLEPKGMFIKSQSKVRAHGGDEQKERWFFIALNNEEATKLKAEEHILGAAYPIGVCVSSGMHEKDFCCQQPTY